MKGLDEVTARKLRGGYYTAPPVVEACLRRVRSLLPRSDAPATWLEPSAGDGAFLRGLAAARDAGWVAAPRVVAVERDAAEAGKCARLVRRRGLDGTVEAGCFFAWNDAAREPVDAVVGNPPFVRYQFVDADARERYERQAAALGVELGGVANLWVPFALLALARLRPGGAFALVLPSELVSTVSAGAFRAYALRHFASLRVELYPRDTFAELHQDVVVVSGRRASRAAASRRVTFREHAPDGAASWTHSVEAAPAPWTRYLLDARELAAFESARALPGVVALGDVARLEVAIVTGANDFFTVDEGTRAAHALDPWARPLLARTADCPGLVFRDGDHAAAREAGRRAWLLDFDASRPEPTGAAAAYLAEGEARGLPARYKCRIREPWYRVPHVRAGALMMTKRAHLHHRLLLNRAGVLTTDTVYRGTMNRGLSARAADLVAGFQNSLTLLSTELEGRAYGGGVLELVPSELARLAVPFVELRPGLRGLDALSRRVGGQRDADESVRRAVDARLADVLPGFPDLLPILEAARARMRARRTRG